MKQPLFRFRDFRYDIHYGGGLFSKTLTEPVFSGLTFDIPLGGLAIVGEAGSAADHIGDALSFPDRPETSDIIAAGRAVDFSQPDVLENLQAAFAVVQGDGDPRRQKRTAIQIVELALRHVAIGSGLERAEAAKGLIARSGLSEDEAGTVLADLPPEQQFRAAVAEALAGSPKVLVIDRALDRLDPPAQAVAVNLLVELREVSGISVVLVGTDLHVARWLVDETVILYQDRMVERGPTAVVLDTPLHPYTRALVAASPSLNREEGEPRVGVVSPPRPFAGGCPFQPLCPAASPVCEETAPLSYSDGRRAAFCHHPNGASPPSEEAPADPVEPEAEVVGDVVATAPSE